MEFSDVTIIIPAYNEEKAIGILLQSITTTIPEIEIIVVNDGSTDRTQEIATSVLGVRIINHEQNRGYGMSLKTGIRASIRDYVLFCDGDGQHTVDDIKKLIESCDNYDMVIGKRDTNSHRPLIRRPGKFIMSKFAEFLSGTKIPDLNSGLRIFKRNVIMRYLHLMPSGFSFSTTSTLAIIKANRKYKFIPITVKRRVGKSTVNQVKHGSQSLLLILRLSVLFEPLKVFISVAFFIFILSIASGIIALITEGGIADTTVLLTIAALIIFMSGLLADQISALRREKHE